MPSAMNFAQVAKVLNVRLEVQEALPLILQITADGVVSTTGWSQPRLEPLDGLQAQDGIYHFSLVATPPSLDFVGQAEQPVQATRSWDGFPQDLKGIRIHAAQNQIEAYLDPLALEGETWILKEMYSRDSIDPVSLESQATASFSGNELRGTSGCNEYKAVAEYNRGSSGNMKISDLSYTEVFCSDELLLQEKRLFDLLSSIKEFSVIRHVQPTPSTMLLLVGESPDLEILMFELKKDMCELCRGTGYLSVGMVDEQRVPCADCNGTGYL